MKKTELIARIKGARDSVRIESERYTAERLKELLPAIKACSVNFSRFKSVVHDIEKHRKFLELQATFIGIYGEKYLPLVVEWQEARAAKEYQRADGLKTTLQVEWGIKLSILPDGSTEVFALRMQELVDLHSTGKARAGI